MSRVVWVLIGVTLAELAGAAFLVSTRLARPVPPLVDQSRLDTLTATDLARMQGQARLGTSDDWRQLAESYLANGYYVAAEQCFHQVTQLNPQDIQARYARGFCLERVGQTSAAIAVLTRTARDADPELARTCWYQIGRCYLREENDSNAEAAFRGIRDFPPAAYQLAKLLIRSGRAEEAIPLVDEQLVKLPNSLKWLQLRMHAAEVLGENELVVELRDQEDRAEYQLILEYGQSFISMYAVRLGLSQLLSHAMRLKTKGTLNDRKAALDKALKIVLPNELWQYRSVLIAAAHVEFGLQNLEGVKQLLSDIEQHTHGGTDVLELHAMVAQAQGDFQAAYEVQLRSARMMPTAEIYLALSRTRADIDPQLRKEYRALADLRAGMDAWRADRIDDASSILSQPATRSLLAENDMYLFYVGETERLLGRLDKAIKAYDDCLEQNPDHGRCLERRKQLVDRLAETKTPETHP